MRLFPYASLMLRQPIKMGPLSIRLGETATSTVTVINKETGEPAYSMIYAGTDNILFDLKGKAKGTYTLLINIEGMKYTGEFTL